MEGMPPVAGLMPLALRGHVKRNDRSPYSMRHFVHTSRIVLILAFCLVFAPSDAWSWGPTTDEGRRMQARHGQKEGNVTLTIVYDNAPADDPALRSDWGFGCVVDVNKRRILFDTGESGDILLSNMRHLGIDPASVDAVVISHIHSDHAGGLRALLSVNSRLTVYVPGSFPKDYKRSIERAGAKFVEITTPREIMDKVFTTGEMGKHIREQSLVIQTKRGLVVITGCAHPGIVEVIRRAQEVGGATPYAAIGGFHTMGLSDARLEKIISSFQDAGVKMVAPCHCSGNRARQLFQKAYGEGYIDAKPGSVIQLP